MQAQGAGGRRGQAEAGRCRRGRHRELSEDGSIPSYHLSVTEQQKIDAFELWCWRLLRVPWTARSSNQSILKEISPGCSLEGLMLKLKLQYFGHLMRRTDSSEKTLMLGKIKDGRRRGWQDGWMTLPTQWTWVWVNSGSWWWTGRPGVLQSMGSQRVRHDWATELHWTIGAELSGPTSPHSVGKPWETSSKLTAANGPGKGRSLEHGRIVEHGHSSSKQEGTSLAVQWLRLHFHCSSCGFRPWSGILHASGQQKRGKKKKKLQEVWLNSGSPSELGEHNLWQMRK